MTRKYVQYKQRDARQPDQMPHPDRSKLRSMMLQKMYEYSLLMTHYNADQAIHLFNAWCGYKGEVLTPHRLFRQKAVADARAQARSQGQEYDAGPALPYEIPQSPMIKAY